MPRRIALIQGHPDPDPARFCHALAEAYREGAAAGGHETRLVPVAELDFPVLRRKADFEHGTPPPAIRDAQEVIRWAKHLVIVYPLWLGSMPALLKAFLEQTLRPGFATEGQASRGTWRRLLAGRSARVVVTMGMPALIYRWYFRAHSLRSLERNILGFSGIGPIKESLIGMVEAKDDAGRRRWLQRLRELGRQGR